MRSLFSFLLYSLTLVLRGSKRNDFVYRVRLLAGVGLFGVARLLEALLPVRDSLELGLDAAQTTPSIEALQKGMALTLEELDSVLQDFGVEVIDPHAEPFDPERHEAMSVAPVAGLPPNSVAQVHQKGYMLHGRVLRPARVTVSKST